jgi:hypothetical protein
MKKIKLYFILISLILLKSCQYERKGVVLHKIYKEKEEYQAPVSVNNRIVHLNHRSEIDEKYILVVNELIVYGLYGSIVTELKIVEVPEINFKNTEVGDTIYFLQ